VSCGVRVSCGVPRALCVKKKSGIVIAFIVGSRQLLYAQDWYVPFDPVANGASARRYGATF
jgi:hypothetical protein